MDLDKLEKLCQEATREPWAIDTTHRVIDIINESQPDIRIALIPREGMNDALFIVEARTALPLLIAKVREAEKVCDAMQKLRAAASELRESTHNNERVIYRTKLDIAEAEMWQALAEWEGSK